MGPNARDLTCSQPLFTEGVKTLQVLQIFPTVLQLDDAIRYMMGTNGGEGAVKHRR